MCKTGARHSKGSEEERKTIKNGKKLFYLYLLPCFGERQEIEVYFCLYKDKEIELLPSLWETGSRGGRLSMGKQGTRHAFMFMEEKETDDSLSVGK